MFFSFVIGLSQGLQPIASFNYGAKKFDRVKSAYKKSMVCGFTMCIIAFIMFQVFPRQIISVFGKGDETYYIFAVNYFRIFLFCHLRKLLAADNINIPYGNRKTKGRYVFVSYKTDNLFTSISYCAAAYLGIDGIMYAGPIADGLAAVVAIVMIRIEFSREEYRVNE